jgi:hypothetical protein
MTCPAVRATVSILLLLGAAMPPGEAALHAQTADRPSMTVRHTEDFEVTGAGDHQAWSRTEWVPLRRRQPDGHPYDTRVKMLYSKTGLYFLMDGTDRTLTATITEDFADLWHEDVYEVFLWPDERHPVYFEYEISPLNYELPILVPNFGGQFYGWRPWHYEGDRLVRKGTSITGGPKEPHATIAGWRAEFFIPYALLTPLQNVPPKPGTRWRGNFYRMDYDDGRRTQWEWAPVGESFHQFERFGDIVFEGR